MRGWQQQYRLVRPLIIKLISKRYLMLIAASTFVLAIACDPRPENYSAEKTLLETLDIKNLLGTDSSCLLYTSDAADD